MSRSGRRFRTYLRGAASVLDLSGGRPQEDRRRSAPWAFDYEALAVKWDSRAVDAACEARRLATIPEAEWQEEAERWVALSREFAKLADHYRARATR